MSEPTTSEVMDALLDLHHAVEYGFARAEQSTDKKVDTLRAEMNRRFDAHDDRFDAIDQRFDKMDQRFDSLEELIRSMLRRGKKR